MSDSSLGMFLRSRRERLDPAAFGIAPGRRRTTGLRREEVAHRAGISATWYTWLEQGRGGAPSADALERIAGALQLREVEREHLFLLGLGRPPEVRFRDAPAVEPRLQRLLDSLIWSPAMVRSATWDVLAWNPAAASVLTDYGALPPEGRNILRMMFSGSAIRSQQTDWQAVARFVVGAFRISAARAGAEVAPLVEELCRTSAEFAALWRENDVREHGTEPKVLRHPVVGELRLEYCGFAVEGRPDLGMIVYHPATEADRAKVARLLEIRAAERSDQVA
ncbi:MAG: helix-turn-helix domain-containing protein [Gluconacetobacter diazotrophicus]|nr:helix-turn-helix domain-containing protein [Gluconacetobacter diazotrophicus]